MRATPQSATIETERLRLRPIALADAAKVAAFTSDLDVARMVTSIPHPNPACAAEGWILLLQARAPLAKDHVFAVEHGTDGLVGCAGAHKGGDWEIGYWIGRPFWSRGFATEAARALAAYVRRELTRGAIVAGHFEDNPASGRVLEKAGFRYTGEVAQRFSIARGARTPTRMMAWAG